MLVSWAKSTCPDVPDLLGLLICFLFSFMASNLASQPATFRLYLRFFHGPFPCRRGPTNHPFDRHVAFSPWITQTPLLATSQRAVSYVMFICHSLSSCRRKATVTFCISSIFTHPELIPAKSPCFLFFFFLASFYIQNIHTICSHPIILCSFISCPSSHTPVFGPFQPVHHPFSFSYTSYHRIIIVCNLRISYCYISTSRLWLLSLYILQCTLYDV